MNKRIMGYTMASYFGGRAEVRVRLVPVPVSVVDFTSMYPTIFILQNLQDLIGAPRVTHRIATDETQAFLESITLEKLYDRTIWPMLNRIALIEPNGDIVPVRMRMEPTTLNPRDKKKIPNPFTITVTPFTSDYGRWYTLGDLVSAKLLGGTVPRILKAIAFEGSGTNPDLKPIDFLGTTLDPKRSIMATVIEERQRAKRAADPEAKRRELALKVLGVSGGYGIFAEINVQAQPAKPRRPRENPFGEAPQGVWYSDIGPEPGNVHDERPGAFFHPLVASLVTGGARLMLAMAETEVVIRGGTFAFCDTDSLGIVAGNQTPDGVPCLRELDVAEIVTDFDRLNPYDPNTVPHLLKREYADDQGLHCYAVSAKRYVLYTRDLRSRLRIVKASESGIGSTIGRTANETVPKLARRIWMKILIEALGIRYRGLRKWRMDRLLAFDVPMRRKLPISQPSVWNSKGFRRFNRTKSYDYQIKPFNFLQTVTPAIELGASVKPIAPYERDLTKSRKLVWTDLESGATLLLDWDGNAAAGSVPVMRLDEFIENYARHPEAKAAGPDGEPAGPETRGVLGRLHLLDGVPVRIGKEIDRLGEDEDFQLKATDPDSYKLKRDEQLANAIAVLGDKATPELAAALRVSERRLRDVLKGRAVPRGDLRDRIIALAKRSPSAGIGKPLVGR